MSALIVIPARYASTRYPGKPLLNETGKYLIQHVYEQAAKSAAGRVVVATDDARIAAAVKSFGGVAVMTGAHESGTDRVAEVARLAQYADADIVVNVQGDEPEIDPALIDRLAGALDGGGAVDMATATAPFENVAEVASLSIVKVVTNARREALYFSRSVIPFDRDGQANRRAPESVDPIYRKHLGIYAYRRDFLLKLSGAPPCALEKLERLEQLRALYMGATIIVEEAENAPHGIDTPDDYAAFVKRWRNKAVATA